MSGDKEYPIHEAFYSWQGEGIHIGRAAFFIRLMGCPIQCPWCDSAGTWHPDYIPEKTVRVAVTSLVAQVRETKAEFVVITGGEPTIHDLIPLTDALHAAGYACHLETSGAFPIRGNIDWITLSPKWQKLPLAENLTRADELKLIVEDADGIQRWMKFLNATASLQPKAIWLHPEWSRHSDLSLLNTITHWVRDHGAPFRAGWQLHKCYNADATDPRSQPTVHIT